MGGVCGGLKNLPGNYPFASQFQENLGVEIFENKNSLIHVSDLVNFYNKQRLPKIIKDKVLMVTDYNNLHHKVITKNRVVVTF